MHSDRTITNILKDGANSQAEKPFLLLNECVKSKSLPDKGKKVLVEADNEVKFKKGLFYTDETTEYKYYYTVILSCPTGRKFVIKEIWYIDGSECFKTCLENFDQS